MIPIPALDPAPLPGPLWLFEALWLVTFVVHLVAMNLVVGGSLLAVASGFGDAAVRRAAPKVLLEINSWAISLAITFGIAPLLFLQVILGRFFYTATVLVAWTWLGMLGILTVAYYLNYLAKARVKKGREARLVIAVEAVLFLAIAAIQVAVNLLHQQPERWSSVFARAAAAFSDPAFAPRFLHVVVAAIAVSGLGLLWVARRAAGRSLSAVEAEALGGLGTKAALFATGLQLVVGLWLFGALPRGVLPELVRGAAVLPIALSIVLTLALLVALVRGDRLLGTATGLMAATIAMMVVTRHQVRALSLAPARVGESPVVVPQWDAIALFLGAFVLCVGLTLYAIARARKDAAEKELTQLGRRAILTAVGGN
jgi:hypothetical protein